MYKIQMKMKFGSKVGTVLFNQWRVGGNEGESSVAFCLLMVILACFLNELLVFIKRRLCEERKEWKTRRRQKSKLTYPQEDNS
mmetsp:Transcript_7943/g.13336  ORF Transcript_7943/g.13336 Transcript_7943/m.13336 type:complete len:83 (-) Transcript_7943:443-691(-)